MGWLRRVRPLHALLAVSLVLNLATLGWVGWIAADPGWWFPGAYAENGARGDMGPRGDAGPRGPEGPVGPDAEDAVEEVRDEAESAGSRAEEVADGVEELSSRVDELEAAASDRLLDSQLSAIDRKLADLAADVDSVCLRLRQVGITIFC